MSIPFANDRIDPRSQHRSQSKPAMALLFPRLRGRSIWNSCRRCLARFSMSRRNAFCIYLFASGPFTDGTSSSANRCLIPMADRVGQDTAGEVVLRTANSGSRIPGRDYQPSGGWVAFTRFGSVDGGAYRQVWVRSPDGVETLLHGFRNRQLYQRRQERAGDVRQRRLPVPGAFGLGAPARCALCIGRAQLLARQQWHLY